MESDASNWQLILHPVHARQEHRVRAAKRRHIECSHRASKGPPAAHRLPFEVFDRVFSFFGPEELLKMEQVCKRWSYFSMFEHHWKALCKSLWGLSPHDFVPPPEKAKLLHKLALCSWRGVVSETYAEQRLDALQAHFRLPPRVAQHVLLQVGL